MLQIDNTNNLDELADILVRTSAQTKVAQDIVDAIDNVRSHSEKNPTREVMNNQTK
jgi:hypothetical protein